MSTLPTITIPDHGLDTDLTALQRMANALVVNDSDSYQEAATRLREVKTFVGKVGEVFDPLCDAAHKAHKAVTTQRSRFLNPATDAESTIKGKMTRWFTAEQKRKAEEARVEQERLRREEEDRRLNEAAALESQGKAAEAEQLVEAPIATPIVTAAPPAPKIQGVSMKEQWSFEITDAAAIKPAYMVPDLAAIGQAVRSLKGRAEAAVGGIKVTMEMVPAASGF
ncbi:MAG: hypothetical protein AB7I42_24080 [Bradyrhizobium sp.]|uniref:hypothetical protein n=1 Tax=Bradyrhizobium sp. TaxID=376 RepID=UPI003D0E670D